MNKREMPRYNEINHEDIKSIDDINKIVKYESELDREREKKLKKGMKTANRFSKFSKVVLFIVFILLFLFFLSVGIPIFDKLKGDYLSYGKVPNMFVMSEYLRDTHNMKEEDFNIEYPETIGRNNSGTYILTPKWNPKLKFELTVESTHRTRIETPEYKSSLLEYLKNKYNKKQKKDNKSEFIMYKEIKNVESEKQAFDEIDKFANEIYDFFFFIKIQDEVPFNKKYNFWPSIKLIMKQNNQEYETSVMVNTESNLEDLKQELLKNYFKVKGINN